MFTLNSLKCMTLHELSRINVTDDPHINSFHAVMLDNTSCARIFLSQALLNRYVSIMQIKNLTERIFFLIKLELSSKAMFSKPPKLDKSSGPFIGQVKVLQPIKLRTWDTPYSKNNDVSHWRQKQLNI